jgi:hypothetical protein
LRWRRHVDEKGRLLLLDVDAVEVALVRILRRKRHVAERQTLIATQGEEERRIRDEIEELWDSREG